MLAKLGNIYNLGIKELRSLYRDPVLFIFGEFNFQVHHLSTALMVGPL